MWSDLMEKKVDKVEEELKDGTPDKINAPMHQNKISTKTNILIDLIHCLAIYHYVNDKFAEVNAKECDESEGGIYVTEAEWREMANRMDK